MTDYEGYDRQEFERFLGCLMLWLFWAGLAVGLPTGCLVTWLGMR